jgi:hypothetical protein
MLRKKAVKFGLKGSAKKGTELFFGKTAPKSISQKAESQIAGGQVLKYEFTKSFTTNMLMSQDLTPYRPHTNVSAEIRGHHTY